MWIKVEALKDIKVAPHCVKNIRDGFVEIDFYLCWWNGRIFIPNIGKGWGIVEDGEDLEECGFSRINRYLFVKNIEPTKSEAVVCVGDETDETFTVKNPYIDTIKGRVRLRVGKRGNWKIVNMFGNWNIAKMDRGKAVLRPDAGNKTAITLVVYDDDDIEKSVEDFIRGKKCLIVKGWFGIREKKLEYALIGRVKEEYDSSVEEIIVSRSKGGQLRKPLSLYYFQNDVIVIARARGGGLIEKVNRLSQLKLVEIQTVFGNRYVYTDADRNNLDDIDIEQLFNEVKWLDEYNTVGILEELGGV